MSMRDGRSSMWQQILCSWRVRGVKLVHYAIGIGVSFYALGCHGVAAQQAQRQSESAKGARAVLSREVEVAFAPDSGFFVVQFDSAPAVQVPVVVVPATRGGVQRSQRDESEKWLIGAMVNLPEGAVMMRSFGAVLGKDRQVAPLPLIVQEISRLPFGGDSEEELRAHLMQRKGVVSKLSLQMREQEATLGRLREDAELVGNFARVVDAQEELAKVRALIQSVEKDITNLERFVRLAASYPVPRNYRNREQQLAGQLKELTEAARRAEQGEFTRRQVAQGTTQHRLRLLEAARTGDLAALEEQLTILRAERRRLEPATVDDL